MDSKAFVEQLSNISLPNVFNPYRDVCAVHDHADSPTVRCLNLRLYLDAAIASGVESVWVGRDCGYRGARRTGIALTDEMHLAVLQRHLGFAGLSKATVSPKMKERTATEVWKIIHETEVKVFLWNVFPFHPYEYGCEMSNRPHTTHEFSNCKEILSELIKLLRPRYLVALGNDAAIALTKLGFMPSKARHPSYGGHVEFAQAIRNIYRRSTPPDFPSQSTFFH